MHTVVTEWDDSGAMYARAASEHDFHPSHNTFHPLRLRDLHDFALYIYERLRAREDWAAHYESLEVGVRLDVGVGFEGGKEGGQKRFFVNEVTRVYGADFFSQHTLGAPQQEVCWGFVEALDGYFGVGKGARV